MSNDQGPDWNGRGTESNLDSTTIYLAVTWTQADTAAPNQSRSRRQSARRKRARAVSWPNAQATAKCLRTSSRRGKPVGTSSLDPAHGHVRRTHMPCRRQNIRRRFSADARLKGPQRPRIFAIRTDGGGASDGTHPRSAGVNGGGMRERCAKNVVAFFESSAHKQPANTPDLRRDNPPRVKPNNIQRGEVRSTTEKQYLKNQTRLKREEKRIHLN